MTVEKLRDRSGVREVILMDVNKIDDIEVDWMIMTDFEIWLKTQYLSFSNVYLEMLSAD